MTFDSMMPRDPFADDPNDPASFLSDEERPEPLTDQERHTIEADLERLAFFSQILSPRGIRGIVFFCEDCEDHHFYDWEILAANMRAMLAGELSPVHEPGAEPIPEQYVSWDYALGYADGYRRV